MTYTVCKFPQGEFAIDGAAIDHIIRSYYRAKFIREYSREVRESESSRFNPLSWNLPDLVSIEVDWDKVNKRTEEEAF